MGRNHGEIVLFLYSCEIEAGVGRSSGNEAGLHMLAEAMTKS